MGEIKVFIEREIDLDLEIIELINKRKGKGYEKKQDRKKKAL